MKTSIEKFYSKISQYIYQIGVDEFKDSKFNLCYLTPYLMAGQLLIDYDYYYDCREDFYFKIEFDDDNNIISIDTSSDFTLEDNEIKSHLVTVLKLREAYVNNDNTDYSIDSLIKDSMDFEFKGFPWKELLTSTYLPYKEKNYFKDFQNELLSINKSSDDFSNAICKSLNNALKNQYATGSILDKIYTIIYDYLKENKNTNYLLDVLNSLKNEDHVRQLICFLINKLKAHDEFANLFFLNMPSEISSIAFNQVFKDLNTYPKLNANFNEDFLLFILKKDINEILKDSILETAISLEYTNIIKYLILDSRYNIDVLNTSKIIDILIRKVDPSLYFKLYEKRIKNNRLKEEEYYFLFHHLTKEQIDTMDEYIDLQQSYWYYGHITTNFWRFFNEDFRFSMHELSAYEFYVLRKELFNHKYEYYKQAIKEFRIAANKELSKKYSSDTDFKFIMLILQENLENKDFCEYLTCERTVTYIKKYPDNKLYNIYRAIVLKDGIVKDIDGYKKF